MKSFSSDHDPQFKPIAEFVVGEQTTPRKLIIGTWRGYVAMSYDGRCFKTAFTMKKAAAKGMLNALESAIKEAQK